MCGLKEFCIGRDVFSCAQHHNVAHHDVRFGNFCGVAFANHAHRFFVIHLIEYLKLFIGLLFKIESETSGQENSHKDANGFKEGGGFVVERKELVCGNS